MPRTEAGKWLLEREAMNGRSFALITADAIDAIEAEARASLTFPESMADAVRRERARIRAVVEGLRPQHSEEDQEVSNWYFDGWYELQDAVLAIIDPKP